MTLQERALTRQGVWPIPAGVMIETRSIRYGSLFLRQRHEIHKQGERYLLSHGVSGRVILDHFIPRGTGPWPRRSCLKIGETFTIGQRFLTHDELLRNERLRKAHYDERSGA